MTKLSRRAPLAIAAALVSLALHASGCTSILGDLPTGEAGDGSVADGGGETGTPDAIDELFQDTNPGPDVVTADVHNDAPVEAGEAGASCGPSNCATGCCNSAGQCVHYSGQSSTTCGTGGVACNSCASGESCSNGSCTCGGAMCAGCCGTGDTCVSPPTNTQCGANGTTCQACAADQKCSGTGQCVCDPSTCAGCCDPSTQHCVTSTTSTQCGTGGATCTACAMGLECSNGACVCDSTSCSMGCCNGGSTGTCELFATQSGTSCGKGGATCGACPTGQTCDGSGNCVCNSVSCPQGCCNGGLTGTCEAFASQSASSCGNSGAACATCTDGLCDTTTGTCACDPNTCPSGCCANGTCVAPSSQSLTSCGTGGAVCGTCAGADSCTNGVCECGGNTACASPRSCCVVGGVGSCADFSNDPANCGSCGHSCQGGTCSNGLCATVTLGQTLNQATITRAGGIAVSSSTVYVSEYVGGTTNSGYIESCPTTGCPGTPATATLFYTDNGNAGLGQILFDPGANAVYWGDSGQSRVYGVTAAGTLLFQASGGVVSGVATDATYLYLADFQGLSYVNKTSGGTPTRIISTLSYTIATAVDPNTGNIWGAARNDNIVASCTRAGTCSQWTWTGGPQGVAIIGGTPYILTQSSGFYRCASAIDCAQANATQLSSGFASNFSYDANYAYFPFGGVVQRCSLSTGCGSSPQTIAAANGNAVWTAVDSTWVYWLSDTGYIQKVAK